ncbi:MAG: hypothetical protein M3347_12500 [Armatimonadota bacterium]|nr:hypothetical protein [Armatimonadota bacterium]
MANAANAGMPQIDPAKSVFINCPYDIEFAPLFDAIVFATVCCRFVPRSALESGTVAIPRMERITQAIFTSKYSVHDLSRCRGEGNEQLARFNMPLELGIAMARRYMIRKKSEQHDWLVMVPEGHHYLKFVSDLAAFDLKSHNGTPEAVIYRVISWLATRPDAIFPPTPKAVLDALPTFQAEKETLKANWGTDIPWSLVIEAAAEAAPPLPEPPAPAG